MLLTIVAACDNGEDGRTDPVPTLANSPTAGAIAADGEAAAPASETEASDEQLSATEAPPTPTNTPEPLAAIVNGDSLPLSAYEAELVREELLFAEAGGPAPGYRSAVLNRLIDQLLISQAAAEFGIVLTDEMVEADLGAIRAQLEAENGPTAYNDWLAANLYDEAEFRDFWRFDMLQRLVLSQVVADVGLTDEHVRARYIQVDDQAIAQQIVTLLEDGSDFGDLARQYSLDETTAQFGGELDYFARGELLVPQLEAVAFTLQVGQYSDIITVVNEATGATTYYLIEVLDRSERELHSDTFFTRQQERWLAWLGQRRMNAVVEIFVSTD